MAFVSIGLLELVHSFNIRSEKSIFKISIFKNIYLIVALIIGSFLQTIVVIVPTFAKIFNVVPLNKTQWIIVAIISILPIVIMEGQKKINETRICNKIVTKQKQKCNENVI